MIDFIGMPKIARLSREIVVSEKIDGTNALVYISDDLSPITLQSGRVVPFLVGSKSRWIFPENDNHGFARWAYEHAEVLLKLGKGWHRGEWMGQGIQRNYGLKEKRFYLFNTSRWVKYEGFDILSLTERNYVPVLKEKQEYCPDCCYVVPVLYQGIFDMGTIDYCLATLKNEGSIAIGGFKPAEGIVIYHVAANMYFKKTILHDESPKGLVKE